MSTTMDQIHHIRDMFYQQDKNISEIASETGLNWKTVKKYVDMEDFNSPPPIPASSEIHESKLDPMNGCWQTSLHLESSGIQPKESINALKMRQMALNAVTGLSLYTSNRRKRNYG